MNIKRLNQVQRLLTANGANGYVRVAAPNPFTVGATVNLTTSGGPSVNGLQVQDLQGDTGSTDVRVLLQDPVSGLPFDASAYLTSQAATITSPVQNLWYSFGEDENAPTSVFTDAQVQAIMLAILPGAATAAANVTVTNFPVTQQVSAVALPLPVGAATETTLASVLAKLNASVAVTGTFWQATQPISAAALPLPAGAATEVTSASILAKLNASVAVTGTFWQATQPVSAVALPLPTGATTEATLAALSAKFAMSTGVVGNESAPIVRVINPDRVDAGNSTTATLGSNAVFTGVGVDCTGYGSINWSANSDVISAVNGVEFQFSPDNVNWSTRVYSDLRAARTGPGQATDLVIRIHDRYFRIKYTNGTSAQGYFRMQTALHGYVPAGDTIGVSQTLLDGSDAIITKSILAGRKPIGSGGTFKDVQVSEVGALEVSQGSANAVFGSMATAEETVYTAFKSPFGLNLRVAKTATANGGTVGWANSLTSISTGVNPAGSATIETREALRYIPGQGSVARFAPVFGSPFPNSTQEAGLLTDTNGFGFGYNGSTFGVLIRKGGVDTWVPQAAWNGDDKFDGTGPSGETLNPLFGSPYQIKMQWLGFGAVRFYVESAATGSFVLVHTHKYANSAATPTINIPNLPVRCKVTNTGNTNNITMSVTSMSGLSEGRSDSTVSDVRNSFSNVVAGVGTAGAAIFALQNRATNIFGNANVNTVNVHLDLLSIRAASTGDMYVQLVLNPTPVGANFTDLSTLTSVIQTDVVGTYTGGTVLMTIPVTSNTSAREPLFDYNIRLVPGDILLVRGVSEVGTITTRCALSWHEEN